MLCFALKILSSLENIPDVIISDIMMPEMDGYEFFREISNEPRWNRIPFLFLSGLLSRTFEGSPPSRLLGTNRLCRRRREVIVTSGSLGSRSSSSGSVSSSSS